MSDSGNNPPVGQAESFDAYVAPILARREPRIRAYLPKLAEFRAWALSEVDAQANYTDKYAPPALETYDRAGDVVNRVVTNPAYSEQHQECYRRGMIALPYTQGAPHLVSFVMGYLLSQADISLHCPVTLTGAVAYVLGYYASEDIRRRYLPDLVRTDGFTYSGGTWATEKHGGSDIGATTTRAVRQPNGFALHGLKWFTSNANSGLALATARPEGAQDGSRGLGLYLVPSHLEDGRSNHYRIRRLKDKLGTKGLPTGEIELLGAHGIEVAAPPDGFKLMMHALEYSRVHNAVGAAGVQRRASREALDWCRSRVAFGRKLIDFPMVRDQLLSLRLRFEASALLAFEAAVAFDAALADPVHSVWLRFATCMAKYFTAEEAVSAARSALELIGGNGYTSDYPIARVLRDAQVLTVWEGPANIQALELMRLLSGSNGGAPFESRIETVLGKLPAGQSSLADILKERLREDRRAVEIAMASEQSAAEHARPLLHQLSQTLAFALMCEAAAESDSDSERRRLAALRYAEEVDPPRIGEENREVRSASLALLED